MKERLSSLVLVLAIALPSTAVAVGGRHEGSSVERTKRGATPAPKPKPKTP